MTTGRTDASLEDRVRAVVAAHKGERGPLLPILHDLSAELGCVPAEAVPVVAHELNLSRADVHGVVSFYHDFRGTPRGRTTVKVCRAEACQSVGAEALFDHARQHLGVDAGGTTDDGTVTLEQVFCLGNCALGPSVLVGDTLHGRVDAARLDALVDTAGTAAGTGDRA